MSIYLVQHGKSMPKEADPEQGLSDEGVAETHRIAQVAAQYHVRVNCIHHSVKLRARQTAEIFAQALKPAYGIKEVEGIKPMDDVTAIASGLQPEDDLMIVGHLPFTAHLAAYLITGSTEPSVFKFQNSGIVCINKFPEESNWQIAWALMPNIG